MADEIEFTGPWREFKERLRRFPDVLERNLQRATQQSAVELVGEIQRGIVDQAPGGKAFAKLSGFTVARRQERGSKGPRLRMRDGRFVKRGGGDAKALLDHGDLFAAIAYVLAADKLSARVGIRRGAKSRDGEDLVNLAKILSEGRVIKITDAMRGYFRHIGHPLKESTVAIVIPPRPFIEPVYEQHLPKIMARYKKATDDAVRFLAGR